MQAILQAIMQAILQAIMQAIMHAGMLESIQDQRMLNLKRYRSILRP